MEQEKEEKKQYPPIVDQLREYAETRIKLGKYKFIEKSTSAVAGLITQLVVVICLLLTFLFASFTLALFLGSMLHSYWQGFGIVALLYLVIALIFIAMKERIKKPLINMFVKMFFSDNE